MSSHIKDNTIWITHDEFDSSFKENYIPESTQLSVRKVANMLFERQAAAVFVF